MPEQTHPPYVSGAVTIPRQLERWLDINPQNGPLKRTDTYVSVPAFNITHVWNGYSEIVGEYHFESPNSLSFKLVHLGNVFPTTTNYTMCVSYVNDDNTVVRYSLVRASGDLIYSTIPLYNGELIKKNFRIEIWNTNDSPIVELVGWTLYTSVLGNQDYRYGVDSSLVSNDPLCQGQQSIGNTVNNPQAEGGISPSLWLDALVGVATTWTDRTSGIVFSKISGGGNISTSLPNFVNFSGQTLRGTLTTNVVPVLMNYQFVTVGIATNLIKLTVGGNNILVKQSNTGVITIDVNGVTVITSTWVPVDTNNTVLLYLTSTLAGGIILTIYNSSSMVLFTGTSVTGIDLTTPVVDIGSELSTRGIVTYTNAITDNDLSNALLYMQSLYSSGESMNLPLTWGICAAPTLNI